MAEPTYYIVHDGRREGPYPLVAMMRKIRSGRVMPSTAIQAEGEESMHPAIEIASLSEFFKPEAGVTEHWQPDRLQSPRALFAEGWKFLTMHQYTAVFAGSTVLVTFLIARPLFTYYGALAGVVFTYLIFALCQALFAVCVLRLNRGQYLATEFFMEALVPLLAPLFVVVWLVSLLALTGFVFIIIPGLAVLALYAFVPFLIIDRRCDIVEVMAQSRRLAISGGARRFVLIMMLQGLTIVSAVLVLPLPVVLPVTTCALAVLYDELSY
jgi:hypothetical protein